MNKPLQVHTVDVKSLLAGKRLQEAAAEVGGGKKTRVEERKRESQIVQESPR